jgi:hypothetical protein
VLYPDLAARVHRHQTAQTHSIDATDFSLAARAAERRRVLGQMEAQQAAFVAEVQRAAAARRIQARAAKLLEVQRRVERELGGALGLAAVAAAPIPSTSEKGSGGSPTRAPTAAVPWGLNGVPGSVDLAALNDDDAALDAETEQLVAEEIALRLHLRAVQGRLRARHGHAGEGTGDLGMSPGPSAMPSASDAGAAAPSGSAPTAAAGGVAGTGLQAARGVRAKMPPTRVVAWDGAASERVAAAVPTDSDAAAAETDAQWCAGVVDFIAARRAAAATPQPLSFLAPRSSDAAPQRGASTPAPQEFMVLPRRR